MDSSFVMIIMLLKNRLSGTGLVNSLMCVSSSALRNHLKLANIYDGNSNKKKTDLMEMIVYECMIGKLNKEPLKDIFTNRSLNILKEKNINIKSLPGYGNVGMRKKDIKSYPTDRCSIEIIE